MANWCSNDFYMYSENKDNLEHVEQFINSNFIVIELYNDDDSIEAHFDSKWTFPEELMDDMWKTMPDKNDETLYMRCLSVEYGSYYHALNVNAGDGWHEI